MPVPRVERFTGDGSTSEFAVAGPVSAGSDRVWVNGYRLPDDGSAYLIGVDGKTIAITPAPLVEEVVVAYLEADS
jgi:hypothetical protein